MNHERRMVKIISGDGSPIRTIVPERNSLCKCGSGKKTKNCCGCKTKFYSTKPQRPIKITEKETDAKEKAITEDLKE